MKDQSTTLRLDGRLVNQWVEVLRESCEQIFHGKGHLIIDMAGVSFADRDGLRLLQQLKERQAVITNCSPF
jgi:anti-anti-sigma regulatory factor